MIRRAFLAGFFTILPLAVTLWILQAIFNGLVGIFRGPMSWIYLKLGLPPVPYWELAILSAAATFLLLVGMGALMGNFIGRQLLCWVDELMHHIPFVKGIYGSTKQLLSAIQSGRGGSFREVVLVEWPHPGSWTLGFLARRGCAWAMEGGEDMVAVYVPTAPNPTSGYVVMLDAGRVRPVSLSPEQALTWVVSGGVVSPGMATEGQPLHHPAPGAREGATAPCPPDKD